MNIGYTRKQPINHFLGGRVNFVSICLRKSPVLQTSSALIVHLWLSVELEQSLGIQRRPQTLNSEYESRTIKNRIERFCIILAPKLERLVGTVVFFSIVCAVFSWKCQRAALVAAPRFNHRNIFQLLFAEAARDQTRHRQDLLMVSSYVLKCRWALIFNTKKEYLRWFDRLWNW